MTLRAVSEVLGMPESTLRVYRDEFDDLIPCSGEGRRRRYGEEGIAVLRRIVAWKQEGRAGRQIRDELARERQPRERARRRTNEERLDEALLLLTAQAGEIARLRMETAALRAALEGLHAVVTQVEPLSFEDVLIQTMEATTDSGSGGGEAAD